MWTTLIVTCSLGVSLHAGIIAPPSSTTPSAPYDYNKDIEAIKKICLTERELEELSGTKLESSLAAYVSINLAPTASSVIGLNELRASLGFAPLGAWAGKRRVYKEQVASAATPEAYYKLIEPQNRVGFLTERMSDEALAPVAAYLDKRIPEIRAIYRRKLLEVRNRSDAPVKIDRKEVDLMIQEFVPIAERMRDAISDMGFNSKCRKEEMDEQRDNERKQEEIDCAGDRCLEPIDV